MPKRSSKMPDRDTNQIAADAIRHAAGVSEELSDVSGRLRHAAQDARQADARLSAVAAELGRRGGLKGGKARAAKLSAAKRKQIARKAAKARWGRKRR